MNCKNSVFVLTTKILYFCHKLIHKKMETVIIKTRTKSDTRFLLDFAKRIGVSAKVEKTEDAEDTIEKDVAVRNAARFKGILTKEEGEKYRQYLKQARMEWDRGI
jgi:hypothetical protein